MAQTIYYIPKITSAKTEYRELAETDQSWLLAQLNEWVIKMATLSNTNNEDLKALRNEYWRKRRNTLPRGQDGMNSPESMIAGILDNILYSPTPQRDLTQKQCDAIEDISNWMEACDNTRFTQIRFLIKVL